MKTVAEFKVNYLQFLDEQANVVTDLPDFAHDPEMLLELYRMMVLTRTFDAKAIALQRTGKMGTFASSLGQEALFVAIGHAMHKDDVLCPYYRDQGALFQRGIKLSDVFNYWGGNECGSDFDNKEDFPVSVPIATQYLHAAGIAYAVKLRKQNRAVVATCGDGGSSKGDFYEAMNFAGAHHLPLVFIINNNKWAISVPLSKQTAAQTLAQKAIATGFEGIQVDGNDVIATHHAVTQAIAKARSDKGPTLIEALTYRLCDHTTADDATRYVDKEELEAAKKVEPMARFRAYLTKQNFWSDEDEKQLKQECIKKVEEAVKAYTNTPIPKPEDMFDYLYAKLPEALKAQRDEVMRK